MIRFEKKKLILPRLLRLHPDVVISKYCVATVFYFYFLITALILGPQIMIHESIEDLKKYVKADVLPLDYGGTFPKTAEELTGKSNRM